MVVVLVNDCIITSGHLRCDSINDRLVSFFIATFTNGKSWPMNGKIFSPLKKYRWWYVGRWFIDIPECSMKWVNFAEGPVFACVLSGECLVGSAFSFSFARNGVFGGPIVDATCLERGI